MNCRDDPNAQPLCRLKLSSLRSCNSLHRSCSKHTAQAILWKLYLLWVFHSDGLKQWLQPGHLGLMKHHDGIRGHRKKPEKFSVPKDRTYRTIECFLWKHSLTEDEFFKLFSFPNKATVVSPPSRPSWPDPQLGDPLMHSLTNWPLISFQTKISIAGRHTSIPPTRYPGPAWNGEVWILVSVLGCDLSTSNVRLIYYCTSVNLNFTRGKYINKRITRGNKMRNQNRDK